MVPTGNAVRAARTFVGKSQADFSRAAGLNITTVSRLECFGDRPVNCMIETLQQLQAALEAHGVQIAPDGRSIHLMENSNGKVHEPRAL